ncbi:MAG: TonB-dependent receptor [Acidobacteriia bacterium]|nr:TonB-dependent receptor [Terriglobia bacterium]
MKKPRVKMAARRMRGFRSLILGLITLTASPRPGQAQVSAAIVGKVEDTSGGGVGGAKITVKNLETGATRVVTTDDAGSFRALSLPLGPQEVKAEKTGFKEIVRTGINLEVGQEAVVNLRLELGEFVQQIAITEEAPVVNVTTASVSGMVGEREIKDLPLNGRGFDNLITLNPGTINFSAMKSPNTNTSNGNTFSVAGRRTGENLFLLNGVEYMGSSQLAVTPGGVSGYLLGIDAVREFNVLTDTYSAEYGKRAGAQVSIVTQSGTNALHGTIFEFVRNSAFDSPGPFDQGTVPPFRRNQFGAAAGGPLKKDRLFLFGNYEGFRQALAVSSLSVVPDANARLGSLPDPSTGVYAPVTDLNPAMLPYMSFWPQPDPNSELMVPSTTSPETLVPSGVSYSHNYPNEHIQEDFGTLRTDYNIGGRDTLSAAYTIDDGNSLIPLADPLFASYIPLRMQVFSLQETHIFSPQIVNTVTVGFSRASFSLVSVPLATFSPSANPFVTGAGPGGIVVGGGATTTANGSITSAGPNNAAGAVNHRNLFTYQDNLQISKGIHQISAGVWFQRLQDNEDSASRQAGQVTFASLTKFLQGTVNTNQFQVVPLHTELDWRSLFGAWYVEDSVRLRHNLTLQAGIRHEFTTGWNEAFGRAANYVTNSQGVLVTAPVVGNSVFSQNNATRLFSPRIGLAWDPFGNGKTAVRAGYGIYYSLIDALAFLVNSLPPYNGSVSCPSAGSVCPSSGGSASLFSFIPFTPGATFPACGTGATPCATFAPQGVQPNAKTPAVQEWNLAIEQQLSHNTSLRVAYVGSFATHELLSIDPNSIPAQICSNPSGCASGGVAAIKSTVSQGTQYIPVQSRPNPNLSGGFFWFTEGNSSYNALQIDVTHRLSKGLQFRGNYTWSKNLDINSGLTGAQANNQAQMVLDRNDLRRDWGPSALNITSQSNISARYELPFGHGQHWLGNVTGLESKLITGWQLNGIGTFLTGFPFTPLVGSNRSGDGDIRNPDRVSINPSFTGPVLLDNPKQWFNPSAFILPTPGTYGNIGRGTLRGPGLADVDLSLFKNTAVSENVTVQFRAEFFNVFNRSNFGPPNATVFSGTAVSPSAGLITTTATYPRQIQFGLKLIF